MPTDMLSDAAQQRQCPAVGRQHIADVLIREISEGDNRVRVAMLPSDAV